MRTIGAALALLVLLLIAGCTSDADTPALVSTSGGGQDGSVAGVLRLSGGPAPGIDRPAVGTVLAFEQESGTGAPVARAATDSRGRFTIQLAPGRFYLRGESPNFTITPAPSAPPCSALHVVHVRQRVAVIVDVFCPVK